MTKWALWRRIGQRDELSAVPRHLVTLTRDAMFVVRMNSSS